MFETIVICDLTEEELTNTIGISNHVLRTEFLFWSGHLNILWIFFTHFAQYLIDLF